MARMEAAASPEVTVVGTTTYVFLKAAEVIRQWRADGWTLLNDAEYSPHRSTGDGPDIIRLRFERCFPVDLPTDLKHEEEVR